MMKHLHLLLIGGVLLIGLGSHAQQEKRFLELGIYNTQNAYPFGKFAGLFGKVLHPGIEAGYGRFFASRRHHEWFTKLTLGCFYHRFVQVGIPLNVNIGYRHGIVARLKIETSLGAGILQSAPATAQLKMNTNGEYRKLKGVGRTLGNATFSLGLDYELTHSVARSISVFTCYQQRVQFPFVKSYVPLLPYNSFMIGVRRRIK